MRCLIVLMMSTMTRAKQTVLSKITSQVSLRAKTHMISSVHSIIIVYVWGLEFGNCFLFVRSIFSRTEKKNKLTNVDSTFYPAIFALHAARVSSQSISLGCTSGTQSEHPPTAPASHVPKNTTFFFLWCSCWCLLVFMLPVVPVHYAM